MNFTTKYFFEIITVIFISYSILGFISVAYGQNVSPPSGTPPAPVSPTVTNTPTPTSPNPNLQYLPQKAYVQSYAPEVGVPSNTVPLQAVPPVVAPAYQQQNTGGFDLGSLAGILGVLGAGGAYLKGHFANKKAEAAKETGQQLAENNVQQATVQQKTLEQLYENMPDKGASITDKPEIKLEKVAEVKDEALKVASKA